MNKKKFFAVFGITFLVLIIAFAGILLISGSNQNKDFDSFLDKQSGSGHNVLIAGVDKDGTRADVIMLVCTDSKTDTFDIISIPRDTYVKLESGKGTKINACMGKENGEELLTNQVRNLTGLPIHSFCKVNFQGLRNIVDILGGMDYDVPIDMHYDDPYQDLHIHLNKGYQHLDGEQVEGLLRFRSGYATADIGRIGTQQDFIKEAVNQKLKFKYITKFPAVMQELKENFETNLSASDVFSLAMTMRSCKKTGSCTLPGEPEYVGGVSYYVASNNAPNEIQELLSQSKKEKE